MQGAKEVCMVFRFLMFGLLGVSLFGGLFLGLVDYARASRAHRLGLFLL